LPREVCRTARGFPTTGCPRSNNTSGGSDAHRDWSPPTQGSTVQRMRRPLKEWEWHELRRRVATAKAASEETSQNALVPGRAVLADRMRGPH
jgi:hypothetical protein